LVTIFLLPVSALVCLNYIYCGRWLSPKAKGDHSNRNLFIPSVLWRCWLGGRKDIRPVKNIEGFGCGGVVSPDGVAPTRTAGASASIITPAPQKSRRMIAYNNIDFGFNPVGAPTCLRKQEVGKPSLNAAQSYAKAEGCVHDNPPRADKLRNGPLGLVPGMLTHLQGDQAN